MNKKIIKSFIERGIYKKKADVIKAALRALVREQIAKEATERLQNYSDETYRQQF